MVMSVSVISGSPLPRSPCRRTRLKHGNLIVLRDCITRNRSSRHYPLSGTDHCIRLDVRSRRSSYSETVSGLTPETTYYVHVAETYLVREGIGYGSTATITTEPASPDTETPTDPETPPNRRHQRNRRHPAPKRRIAPTSTASPAYPAPPRTLTPGGSSSAARSRTPPRRSAPSKRTTATRSTYSTRKVAQSAPPRRSLLPTASSGSNSKAPEAGIPSSSNTPRPAPCAAPPSP